MRLNQHGASLGLCSDSTMGELVSSTDTVDDRNPALLLDIITFGTMVVEYIWDRASSLSSTLLQELVIYIYIIYMYIYIYTPHMYIYIYMEIYSLLEFLGTLGFRPLHGHDVSWLPSAAEDAPNCCTLPMATACIRTFCILGRLNIDLCE